MKIEDRLEIQDLVARYAYYVDSFMIPEWVALFAPDAVLDESEFGMGRHECHQGLAAYGNAIAGRVKYLLHLMTNHLIWDAEENSARGTSFAIVESMQNTGSRARYLVEYNDQYQRIGGRWVFQTRHLKKSFPPEVIAS